ncbi:hypothetical protein [Saccharothrix sp.]|uniref:hypothetical protein n=1 Tax=Saccharothrix sp. TaxID=1873460 RepID=UPI002810C085|nr:hypothetical protein [Saccharothrix sp.]
MTTTTYETQTRIGTTTYLLRAAADPDLSMELTGIDTSGATVAEGTLRLPADASATVGRLLAQVLEALGKLGAPPPRSPRSRPANANHPWTDDLDAHLRATWLSASPLTPTTDLIRTLARDHQRSATSIRARLAKVGCDPDIPGRLLSPEAADVLGVQGRTQGVLRAEPDSPGGGVE